MTARVVVATLGGTIAMAADEQGGIVPRLDGEGLVRSLPDVRKIADLTVETPLSLPGAHLSLANLTAVAAQVRGWFDDGVSGVVLTQGTDTMEETAFLLDLLLDTAQPTVVTGAMRSPEADGADGPANLTAAIRVAAAPSSRERGVLVVMNDTVHSARWVSKTHTSRPDAFSSGDAGAAGTLTEGRIRWFAAPSRRHTVEIPPGAVLPDVPVVATWLGDQGTVLEAALGSLPPGLVVEALGAGHVPTALIEPLGSAAADIPVVLTSRTRAGSVHRQTYGFPGSERDLLARGLICGGDLPAPKARLFLAATLAAGWSRDRIANGFDRLGGHSS